MGRVKELWQEQIDDAVSAYVAMRIDRVELVRRLTSLIFDGLDRDEYIEAADEQREEAHAGTSEDVSQLSEVNGVSGVKQ